MINYEQSVKFIKVIILLSITFYLIYQLIEFFKKKRENMRLKADEYNTSLNLEKSNINPSITSSLFSSSILETGTESKNIFKHENVDLESSEYLSSERQSLSKSIINSGNTIETNK